MTCCAPLQVALDRYRRWSKPPRSKPKDSKRPLQQLLDKKLLPDFKNGRKLRDYQVGWRARLCGVNLWWCVFYLLHDNRIVFRVVGRPVAAMCVLSCAQQLMLPGYASVWPVQAYAHCTVDGA